MDYRTVEPKEVVDYYHQYMARKKSDQKIINISSRVKCYDMDIANTLRRLISNCPSVKFKVDSESTSWFLIWRRKEVSFTLIGPKVDAEYCMDRIEEYLLDIQLKMLGK